MKRQFLFVVASTLLFILPRPVFGDSLTWSLQDVGFTDGGTLTGSFEYQSGLGYDWSITANGGNQAVFPDFTYNPADSTLISFQPTQLILSSDVPLGFAPDGTPEDRILVLVLQSSSSPNGDEIIPLSSVNGDSRECFGCNPFRIPITGDIEISGDLQTFPAFGGGTSAVPEPSSMCLCCAGLLSMIIGAALRRKRMA
jgi:hypothetical protein